MATAQGEVVDINAAKRVRDEVNALIDGIIEARDERKAHNQNVTAMLDKLVTKGFPKKAVKLILDYEKMDEDDRRLVDAAFEYLRGIRDMPRQAELFEPLENVGDEQSDD